MLKLDNIDVEISGTTILHDISFALKPGAATLLVGRNGAGKTTLLRTIMGLVSPVRGKIAFDGDDITRQPGYSRTRLGIGYAPEDRRLISAFSIEENIVLPLLAQRRSAADQRATLEIIYDLMPQLEALKDRPAGSVSGGQGKMVALGRALATAERFIMLDEPFQGLAPALALDYARTLRRLKEARSQMTFLITESSPDLLADVADFEILIERGSVAEQREFAAEKRR